MTGWARTTDGWAVNLDGSNAAAVFSLPRLEVRGSARGWRCLCLLTDGTRHEHLCGSSDSVHAARAAALAQAGRMLGPDHAPALTALRPPSAS
jgi:hypothetical protein